MFKDAELFTQLNFLIIGCFQEASWGISIGSVIV